MRQPANYAYKSLSAGGDTLVAGRLVLMGFSASNQSSTTAGTASIFDGSASGVRLFLVQLNILESTREWFATEGIAMEQGLFVIRSGINVDFCAFYTAETRLDDGVYETVESLG